MPMPVQEDKFKVQQVAGVVTGAATSIANNNNLNNNNNNKFLANTNIAKQEIKTPAKVENTLFKKENPVGAPMISNNNNNNFNKPNSTPVAPNSAQANIDKNKPSPQGINQQQQANKANTNTSINNNNNKTNGNLLNNNNNNNKSNQNINNNNNNKGNNNKNQVNSSNLNRANSSNSINNTKFNKNDKNGQQQANKYNGDAYHSKNDNKDRNQQQNQNNAGPVVEKKFTGRCRLFVGNLPTDINEAEFKELFSKYGETGEVFLNTQRSFGFIKLETRINAEHAKQELDGFTFKGRCIRVRFASHGAAVRVKNLSAYISNEYLEQAFSMFGPVERAVVIVDDKGRPTGEGIVEFERKPASIQCINKCTENCFILTGYPKPIVVEPLEQKDEEDGLTEKSIVKNSQYYSERETPPHFAPNNSFEHKLALKWRELYELEKQVIEEGKKRVEQAREMLEYEIEQALIDHKTMKLKEDLKAKQEELQRIEDMRKSESQRRQDMEIRRHEDERRRQEEMMMMRKQQENMMMQNQRGGNQGMQFEQGILNQPHQAGLVQGGAVNPNGPNVSGGGNRRGGGNNNAGINNGPNLNGPGLVGNQPNGYDPNSQFQMQFQQHNQSIQQLPPAQQQALIAAQLSFAMAAAAQQGNLNLANGMFENPPMNNNNNNNSNNSNNNNNNSHNNAKQNGGSSKDEHRSGGSGSRRQFDRRGGRGGGGGGRDDSYPGYDNKRARF